MNFATTKQRIIQYIDYKGISVKEFLEKTEIKRGFLDSDKLKASVSDLFITKIIANFQDINIEWLLTGKGSMLKEPTITERMDDFAIKNGLNLHSLGLVIGLSALETSNLIKANETTEGHINAICEKFNIPKDWFLTGKGKMPRIDREAIDILRERKNNYVKEENKTSILEKENGLLKENIISLKETNELLKYKIKSLETEIETLKNKLE